MYGLVQGSPLGGSSSPNMRCLWSQQSSHTSPHPALWCQSPLGMRNYNSSRSTFMYQGSPEHQMLVPCSTSHSSTPDTSDSGFWDAGVENSPTLEGQYSQLEDSWSGTSLEIYGEPGHSALVQSTPLPELSLQEILGELNEDWLGGEGQPSCSR